MPTKSETTTSTEKLINKETNGNVLLRLISRESCQTCTLTTNFEKEKSNYSIEYQIYFLWLRGGGEGEPNTHIDLYVHTILLVRGLVIKLTTTSKSPLTEKKHCWPKII